MKNLILKIKCFTLEIWSFCSTMLANVNIATLSCSKILEEFEIKPLCLNGQQVTNENGKI